MSEEITSQPVSNPDLSANATAAFEMKQLYDTAKVDADSIAAAASAISKMTKEIDQSRDQILAALSDAQTKLADIANIATSAVSASTKIVDQQGVIATKSDHIQKAQEHADKVRGELDRVLTATAQQLTEAEGLKNRAQSAADKATSLLTAIETTKGAVDTTATAAAAAQKAAESAAASTKGLADKSTKVEEGIANYEKKLTAVVEQCENQLKVIHELLRSATTAGLATAFDQRRQTFIKPNNRWQWIFVLSLICLIAISISGLIHVYNLQTVPEWGELARLWLARLPIAGALIWLALHASREAALAKRLEEDYGYKAAIAACFEGFRRQMSEIDTDKTTKSQLAKLCENTLATIASPPGRIYDAHKLVVSPTEELTDVAKAATSVASTLNSNK